MRSETGKRPQAPSNRPLQPIKRQNDMTFGQPRKLCLLGGVLPRAIEHSPPRSTFSIFSRSVFSTPLYFRGMPNFAFLGRFEGGFRLGATSCPRENVARIWGVCRVSVISEETGYSHLANACSVLRYISLQKVKDGNINAKIKFGAPVLMLKSKDYVL